MMTRNDKFQVFATLVAGVVTIYTGYRTFAHNEEPPPRPSADIMALLARTEQEARDIERMSKAIEAIEASKGTIADPKIAIKLAHVEAGQADLQQRMKALEDSLIATPATSLALPLLRKDLDTLRERMQANELDSKERERRSTDTMKWIFGLVAALITGVIAQWFGSRFKKA
jgi:hypothetical protein